ncbi:MAG: hypothetical protein AVDCRST_MAG53-1267 [uncultured Solirubrobacteraceae bacterium]|uniref:Uncharacterized protein n=1 Tax=uncultured Solirubrobacteraceae bacterium TaxID=1162706 RepID=A0A6J4RD54_9ACTN|nr:MAG: hypothetical protein AVDCRST_MAG53-1267 [uncultured Solirubrobacteraceae bacterium]
MLAGPRRYPKRHPPDVILLVAAGVRPAAVPLVRRRFTDDRHRRYWSAKMSRLPDSLPVIDAPDGTRTAHRRGRPRGTTHAARSAARRATTVKPVPGHESRMRLRRLASSMLTVGVIAATGLVAVGCGDEEETSTDARPSRATAFVSEAEAQYLLDRDLEVQYVLRRSDALAGELDPKPVVGQRLTVNPLGKKFDLLVFATPAAAEAAEDGVRLSDVVEGGGEFRRAANLVAVFPEPPKQVAAYRGVVDVLDGIERKCARPGDPEFGEICFGVRDDILPSAEDRPSEGDEAGPAGPGTEPDELLEEASTVTLDGLAYTPVRSRQLNPSLRPDRPILEGVDVDRTGGPLLVGVFLRVCNEEGEPRVSTDRFVLKDAFGTRIEPVEPAPDNALAYRPRELREDECLPESASAADETLGGRALVFRVPLKIRRNVPLGLEITGESGRRQTIEIGL